MFKLFKKKETNNSVMVLLKKLKRHDTKVVAVAVIIALILSGGLIYVSTPIVANNATEEFAESTNQSNRETSEKLSQISDYLGELDKVVTSNQKSLSKITEYNNNSSSTSSSKETVTETDKTTNTINNKVTELGGTLKEVHTLVTTTNTKIESLQKEIEKNEKSDREQIEKDFELVNQELTKIQTAYENARKENKELIEKLQKEVRDGNKKIIDGATENHTALLTELQKLGKSLDEKNTKTITNFQADITKLSESVNKQFETMNTSVNTQFKTTNSNVNEKINNVNTNVNNKFDTMNESVTNQFNTMNSSVDTGIAGLKEYIDTTAGSINKSLEQVFQRVSDGKKLLASTLLTKGITIKEDATFLEFSEAILKIPTTITIEGMKGEIVYEKHYHRDGNGTQCNEKYVPESRKGGCYTQEYIHYHDESCYKYTYFYEYMTAESTHRHEWVRDDNSTPIYRYTCDHCKYEYYSPDGQHRESCSTLKQAHDRNGADIEKRTIKKVICGMKSKQRLGYSCSCGYLHGQILKAHIDYSKNKKNVDSSQLRTSNVVQLGDDALGNEALDALMQLTEYDMNAEKYEPEKEDEIVEEASDNNTGDTFENEESSYIEVSEEAADSDSLEEKENEPSTEESGEAGSFDENVDNSSDAASEASSGVSLETEEENSEENAKNELS